MPIIQELGIPCDNSRMQRIEEIIATSDGMGHGPDIGSSEWHSVVEFKLGLRGNDQIPEPGTVEWCSYIENVLTTGDA